MKTKYYSLMLFSTLLLVVSSVILGSLTMQSAWTILGSWVQEPSVKIFLAYVITIVIDGTFGVSVFLLFMEIYDRERSKTTLAFLTALALISGGISVTSSDWSSETAASIIVADNTGDIGTSIKKFNIQNKKDRASLQDELNFSKKQLAEKKGKIEKAKSYPIANRVINSKHDKSTRAQLKKWAFNGNNKVWAASAVALQAHRVEIKKAMSKDRNNFQSKKRKLLAEISAKEKKVDDAQDALENFILNGSASGRIASKAIEQMSKDKMVVENKRAKTTLSLRWINIVSFLVVWLTSFTLVFLDKKKGQKMGKLKSLTILSVEVMFAAYNGVLSLLEVILRVDLNNDGYIGLRMPAWKSIIPMLQSDDNRVVSNGFVARKNKNKPVTQNSKKPVTQRRKDVTADVTADVTERVTDIVTPHVTHNVTKPATLVTPVITGVTKDEPSPTIRFNALIRLGQAECNNILRKNGNPITVARRFLRNMTECNNLLLGDNSITEESVKKMKKVYNSFMDVVNLSKERGVISEVVWAIIDPLIKSYEEKWLNENK